MLLRLDDRVQRKTVNTNILDTLATVQVDETNVDDQCSICMEKYSLGQILKRLPCQHVFHSNCIEDYLKEFSNQCPLDNLPLNWIFCLSLFYIMSPVFLLNLECLFFAINVIFIQIICLEDKSNLIFIIDFSNCQAKTRKKNLSVHFSANLICTADQIYKKTFNEDQVKQCWTNFKCQHVLRKGNLSWWNSIESRCFS